MGVDRERPPYHAVPAGSELRQRDLQQRRVRQVDMRVLLVHPPAVTVSTWTVLTAGSSSCVNHGLTSAGEP
jgi:hypothetical protein